jgi:hypothetical protein
VNGAVDIGADEFVDALPATGALTPKSLTSAAGSSKSLKAVYTDVSGYRDFSAVDILVTDDGVANAIWVNYNQSANKLALRNDAGTAYQPETCAPGEVRILKNTQGSLNCAKTTMSGTGSNLIMVWDITPTVPSIASVPKKIMVRGSDSMHHTTNWVQKGSWTIRP